MPNPTPARDAVAELVDDLVAAAFDAGRSADDDVSPAVHCATVKSALLAAIRGRAEQGAPDAVERYIPDRHADPMMRPIDGGSWVRYTDYLKALTAARADERATLTSQADAGLAPLVPSPAEDGDREVVERILATCDDIADTMLRCTAKIHPDQTKPTDWEPYPTHVRLMGGSWTPVKHADLLRARDAEIETLLSRLAALRAERDELRAKGEGLCNAYGAALIEIHDLKTARDALAQRVGEVEGLLAQCVHKDREVPRVRN